MTHKRHGRYRLYTRIGIARVPCYRCGARAEHQWKICADGKHRPICLRCDVALNALVMRWMRFPVRERAKKIARYRRRAGV